MPRPIDYLFTERELAKVFQDVPMPIEGRRRFVADYVAIKSNQDSTSTEITDITNQIAVINEQLEETNIIALMALMT